MTVSLIFISIIILKNAIDKHYSGSVTDFKSTYMYFGEDENLIALNFMSQGEADETMDSLI